MTDKKSDPSETEVRSTFTDDDDEVNTTDESTGLGVDLRRISEAAVAFNAVDQFASGAPIPALIFSAVAVGIYYRGKRKR